MSVPSATNEAGAAPGKYLTFGLADEHYGLEVLCVQEIVGLLPVTRIPRLPSFVAGVVNLRGRVIPVVDLRQAFGLSASEMHERTCIIIVNAKRSSGATTVMGILVDEVSDVADLSADAIEETPEFASNVDTSFIKGVGRAEGRVLLLLDIDKALSATELDAADHAVASALAQSPGQESHDSEQSAD
jgi:purine-binding chemotaxis protein CheW